MKARIKKTGEIFNIPEYSRVTVEVCDSFGNPLEYMYDEVEILQDKSDDIDWEQRRYEIAKDAMCANICAPVIPGIDPNPSFEAISRHACALADALIAELKKGGK